MSRQMFVRAAAIAAMGVASGAVVADEITIEPDRDNTLYENLLGALSNGAGDHFFAGKTAGLQFRRGLLRFDVAGAVPAGSTINSVSLRLNMSRAISGAADVSIHDLLADWGEGESDAAGEEGGGAVANSGDATWLHTFYNNMFWATPGGDFDPAVLATTSVATEGFYTWSSAGMASSVQSWLDAPAENYGWILIGAEANEASAKRFDSRENPNAAARPKLTIDFTPPAGCPADWNGDTVVDSGDFFDFIADFIAGDADFNSDTVTDSGDFFEFIGAFIGGC